MGDEHTCGVRVDGKVLCWGKNDYGQAPAGPSADSFTSVSAGYGKTCGIRVDGHATCWGRGTRQQSADTFKSVHAGYDFNCGIRTDETLSCWGDNFFGQSPLPASTRFSTLSVNRYDTCGVRVDGQLFCWGSNFDQEAPPWNARN
ncbi:RCC1 domain-containing protein [Vulgatibacter incomptus]|uniref:non-specific serine/threonine protein kinase n=1 Tax=Vulgatibacter incomptus TaxID=1391653 RepID=A0A0K1PGP8_9BACT|nr:RCC1 domain-containing protein [Vulgatibacter incomptus]AKU92682.1 BNR repeat domain protein [Vulgatibacter incomptus]